MVSGKLAVTEVTPDEGGLVTITNNATGNLKVSKTVTVLGEGGASKQFPITITLTDAQSAALTGELTLNAKTTDKSGAETDTPVTFTAGVATVNLKDGDSIVISGLTASYKYTVSEDVDSIPSGYSQVSATGTTGTIEKGTTPEAAFVNTYAASGTASFPVKKVLSVSDGLIGPETWSYTINVAPVGTAPSAETMIGTVTQASDTANFGPFTFTAAGSYSYTVTETGTIAGVTNDSAATTGKTVTVTVTDKGDGTLDATASSTADSPLTFTNTYTVTSITAGEVYIHAGSGRRRTGTEQRDSEEPGCRRRHGKLCGSDVHEAGHI